MQVYRERLSVPLTWWLLGLTTIALLATEVVAGYAWPLVVSIYAVLVGGFAAVLLTWGRPRVEVEAGELRAGGARLPLAAVGEVTALDEAQTRALRGPRGDPAAFLLTRPYLRRAVYVEVTGAGLERPPGRPPRRGRRIPLLRRRAGRAQPRPHPPAPPYWLVSTRHPAELAAAIIGSRPAARTDGAAMG